MLRHPAAPASGWLPVSSCGPGCLPPVDGHGVRAALVPARLCGLAAVLVGALVGGALLRGGVQARWLRACHRAVLRCSGVRLLVAGELGDGGELLAVNHLSWVEVLAVGALRPVRMVAKREMGDWPLIGGFARRSGALFVDRAGLRGLRATVADTADALRAGADVAVFPEGTTWCGAAAGPLRRAVFQAAIDAGAPVRPVAVVLRLPGGERATAAAFIGDETLWDSLLRVLRLPGLDCELTLLPALPPSADRRELARRAGDAIAAVTGVPHPVGGRREQERDRSDSSTDAGGGERGEAADRGSRAFAAPSLGTGRAGTHDQHDRDLSRSPAVQVTILPITRHAPLCGHRPQARNRPGRTHDRFPLITCSRWPRGGRRATPRNDLSTPGPRSARTPSRPRTESPQ